MTTRLCPYCKSNSDAMPRLATTTATDTDGQGYPSYTVRMVCVYADCKNLTTAKFVRTKRSPGSATDGSRKLTALAACEWAPNSASAPEYPLYPTTSPDAHPWLT